MNMYFSPKLYCISTKEPLLCGKYGVGALQAQQALRNLPPTAKVWRRRPGIVNLQAENCVKAN